MELYDKQPFGWEAEGYPSAIEKKYRYCSLTSRLGKEISPLLQHYPLSSPPLSKYTILECPILKVLACRLS